jgi:hypothetical protein
MRRKSQAILGKRSVTTGTASNESSRYQAETPLDCTHQDATGLTSR